MSSSAAAMAQSVASPWAPDAQRVRARRLLLAGLLATHVVGLVAVGVFGIVGGGRSAGSALLSAAVVIVFFGVGQGVQVLTADAAPRTALFASLGSYVLRVVGLGVLLKVALPYSETGLVDKAALFVSLTVCVLAWLAGEIVAFRRLRFPVYDTEYLPPKSLQETA